MIELLVNSPTVRPAPTKFSDRLEAAFLSEMLKIAMPAERDGAFSGGIGESQFASFLTDQYADAMAARLELGLGARGARTDG
ncbi:rod-binding protein [Paracoccus sanguinis]|uniref:rod-binding protein n=1 Tax=Paracoccus sanguinis TaxID=1545044 RepID=UPI0014519001|nr:rod-binding protein [Paracoccus sanguinis]QJD17607.1 hypothetical protein HGN31_12540 [Paracoccus sanguinis]